MTALAALYRQREHLSLRTRLLFTFGAVAALHLAAAGLLLLGGTLLPGPLAGPFSGQDGGGPSLAESGHRSSG